MHLDTLLKSIGHSICVGHATRNIEQLHPFTHSRKYQILQHALNSALLTFETTMRKTTSWRETLLLPRATTEKNKNIPYKALFNRSRLEAMSGKRGRADVGISKDQYEAEEAFGGSGRGSFGSPSTAGFDAFPRASDHVLQARKIVTKSSSALATTTTTATRASESHRQFTALNRAFAVNIKSQWQHNKRGDWLENMKEYIMYARDVTSKFGAQEGKVLTFGSGDCGQLGHGVEDDDDMMVKFPRVLEVLERKHIVRIACGGLHTGAIAVSGEVFTWGCNDDGALGRVGEENFPAKVEGFGPESCAVQVCYCWHRVCVCVVNNRDMYVSMCRLSVVIAILRSSR